MVRHRRQPRVLPLLVFLVAFLTPHRGNVATANQYKVGDLNAWGVPPPGKSQLYSAWSQTHRFKIGDSLRKLPGPPFLPSPGQYSAIRPLLADLLTP